MERDDTPTTTTSSSSSSSLSSYSSSSTIRTTTSSTTTTRTKTTTTTTTTTTTRITRISEAPFVSKHAHLKGRYGRITSVAIPIAVTVSSLYLIGRGIYNIAHNGEKE